MEEGTTHTQHKLVLVSDMTKVKLDGKSLKLLFAAYNPVRARLAYRHGQPLDTAAIEFACVEDATKAIDEKSGCLIEARTGGEVAISCELVADDVIDQWFGKKKRRYQDTKGESPVVPTFNSDLQLTSSLEDFVREKKFCIIDFEASCSTGVGGDLPCEVGVSVANILEGEIRHFHRFIDPGPVPLGSLSTAIWTTKYLHGIPYEGFELGEKDYHKLWQDLIEFISDACDNSPIIYAKGAKMEKSCLAWLAAKADTQNTISVHEIEELIHFMCSCKELPIDPTFSERHLNRMRFVPVTKCAYHDTLESDLVDYHCALSDTRAAFLCIQAAAEELGLKPGDTVRTENPEDTSDFKVDMSFMHRDNWGNDTWQEEPQPD